MVSVKALLIPITSRSKLLITTNTSSKVPSYSLESFVFQCFALYLFSDSFVEPGTYCRTSGIGRVPMFNPSRFGTCK